MTLHNALEYGVSKLLNSSTASLDTEILLADTLGRDKAYLFSHPADTLAPFQEKEFKRRVQHRSAGYSVAVIVGYREFYGHIFQVTEDTLVPRPASELLVEKAIECMKKGFVRSVLDMGTGSGNLVISIALATKDQGFIYHASDISDAALDVAQKNAKTHDVAITFFASDLFQTIPVRPYNLIVANLPYLST